TQGVRFKPIPPRTMRNKDAAGPSLLNRSTASGGDSAPVRARWRKARNLFLGMKPVSLPPTLNPFVLIAEAAIGGVCASGTACGFVSVDTTPVEVTVKGCRSGK